VYSGLPRASQHSSVYSGLPRASQHSGAPGCWRPGTPPRRPPRLRCSAAG